MADGIVHSVKSETIQMDKAGRVVLPKPLREQFNLLPGDKLRLSVDGKGIRLEPTDVAGTLVRKVEQNMVGPFTVVTLTAREYVDLVTKLGREGITGGQSYDALHLRCAEKTGVDRIYTFNVRHFQGLAPLFSAVVVAP